MPKRGDKTGNHEMFEMNPWPCSANRTRDGGFDTFDSTRMVYEYTMMLLIKNPRVYFLGYDASHLVLTKSARLRLLGYDALHSLVQR